MERLCVTAVEIEVPFRHVDLMGVVWHGHYFEYLEEARTALLRARSLDDGDLIGERYAFFVIESRCRYTLSPLLPRSHARERVDPGRAASRVHRLRDHEPDARAALARGRTRSWRPPTCERNLLLETPDEIRRRLLA